MSTGTLPLHPSNQTKPKPNEEYARLEPTDDLSDVHLELNLDDVWLDTALQHHDRQKRKKRTFLRTSVCLCITVFVATTVLWTTRYKRTPTSVESVSDENGLTRLESLCSVHGLQHGTYDRCADICLPLECCWNPKVFGAHCPSTEFCARYQPCTSLLTYKKADKHDLPAPPENLHEMCALNPDKTLADHDGCLKACLPGECCLESSRLASCFAQHESMCQLYNTPCSHLPPEGFISDYGGIIPPPPDSLSLVCSPKQLESEDMRRLCESFCTPALCCIDRGDLANCAAGKRRCEEYVGYCRNVWPDEERTQIPKALDVLCEESRVKTELGKKECLHACLPGSCCWAGPLENCKAQNEEVCRHYEICQPILATKLQHLKLPEPPTDLVQICSHQSLSTDTGLEECKKECSKAICCFEQAGRCFDNNPSICPKYNACLQLPENELSKVGLAPPLEELCTRPLTPEGHSSCVQACAPGSCCNAPPPNSCFPTHSFECLEYEPCRAMTIVPPPPPDLAAKCSEQNLASAEGRAICQDACHPSSCCRESRPANCYALNPETCAGYRPCMALPEEEEHDVSTVAKVCSLDSLKTKSGREGCLEECDKAWCCLAKGESSCTTSFCGEYLPYCEDILMKQGTELDYDDPLEITCSKKHIATLKGREECERECSGAACCLAQGKFSCLQKKEEWCRTRLSICEVLDTFVSSLLSYAPGNIVELCSDENIKRFTGREECEKACAPSSCCWEKGGENCREGSEEACASFSLCEKLLD